MISIDDTEEQDKLVEETPPLKFSTPKQDELNKQINVENEILVVLYKKKGRGVACAERDVTQEGSREQT